ncbi:MAG TPA: RusA family crossover junction endodeoxyribonuclease, partial [Candidatus Wallbacteria bacterium]|nr:RusA family crossover junction endodeoxyribonuclease [Candidatus Wallbacteria bacterium]
GKAQAQQRAGEYVGNDGKIHHYDQKESKSFRKEIKDAAFVAVRGRWPRFDVPVNLAVQEFRALPSSWSEKKKHNAIMGIVRPTSKPDLKNIIWGVEDSLNGLMWKDDSRIVSFDGSGKFYSAFSPFLRVEVTPLITVQK